MYYDQSAFNVRFEWGLAGLQRVGALCDVVIIVDVLSFSTCVDVAVGRGAVIFPCRWRDERLAEYAREMGAVVARWRGQGEGYSLSPASMMEVRAGERIVLPSPNGSALSAEAQTMGKVVLAGCLRNCRAVGRFVASRGGRVAVIGCGERWPDGTMRPTVEDLVGAGAIIAELPGMRSPEALAAVGAWLAAKENLAGFVAGCSSGRELGEKGFERDVQLAGEVGVSDHVPLLGEGGYRVA